MLRTLVKPTPAPRGLLRALAASSACVVLAAGCTSLSYKEPTDGPRARVRFATNGTEGIVLRTYSEPGCGGEETEWMRLRDTTLPMLVAAPKSLGMPLAGGNPHASKEVYVVANKPVNGLFFGAGKAGNKIYSCGSPFAFTFREGVDYEVFFASIPQFCHTVIREIVRNDNGEPVRNQIAHFDNRAGALEARCMERFKQVRWF
jgi:hypothetical protein